MTEAELKDLFLEYEVAGSWWCGFVSWEWLQKLAANYFARKVLRKYAKLREFQKTKLLHAMKRGQLAR